MNQILKSLCCQVTSHTGSDSNHPLVAANSTTGDDVRRGSAALIRFEHRRHTSVAMNRNYSETSMISIPADKNNKAIILDVGGKKHKIRGEVDFLVARAMFIHFSVDNFNIYPNTRLGKLVKAKKLDEILDLCDDFCPGEPPEYFFDR